MKKVILVLSFVSFALFSCEQEQISSQGQASGKGSKLMSPAVESGVVADLPPEMPESGPSGGDLNFILPSTPTIDDGAPIVLPGKAGAAFTQSGSSSGQSILFATAPQAPRPLIVVTNARGLAMTISFIYSGTRHIIRFYHSVTTYNGSIHLWTEPKPVQVLLGTLGAVPGYTYPEVSPVTGKVTKWGQWNLTTQAPGEVSGQLFISQLSFNSQGQITLKAVLTMPGKTINIDYVNWNRWN
jgi:hypothetical protein